MELVESSGVNGPCYGQFRVPVRVNQVSLLAQVLQWVRRLEGDQLGNSLH